MVKYGCMKVYFDWSAGVWLWNCRDAVGIHEFRAKCQGYRDASKANYSFSVEKLAL